MSAGRLFFQKHHYHERWQITELILTPLVRLDKEHLPVSLPSLIGIKTLDRILPVLLYQVA